MHRTHPLARVAVPVALVALVGCASSGSSSGEAQTTAAKVDPERAHALERLDASAQILGAFRERIPADVAARAQCVVAIPSMSKGGLIVGASGGSGFSSCKTSSGWSAPAPVTIGGGSLGAQIGYQESDVVTLVTSAKGIHALSSDDLKVGGNVSATAGPVGTGSGRSTDVALNGDLVSYSRSKGLFAGADLNGTAIKLDNRAAGALYGSGETMHAILNGAVEIPSDPSVQTFMNALRAGFGDGTDVTR